MLICDSAGDDLKDASRQVGDEEVSILLHVLREAGGAVSGSKSLVNSVLVCSPHVVNALLDVLVKGSSGHHGGYEEPEGHVQRLQLKQGRPHGQTSKLVGHEGSSSNTSAPDGGTPADGLHILLGVLSEVVVSVVVVENANLPVDVRVFHNY